MHVVRLADWLFRILYHLPKCFHRIPQQFKNVLRLSSLGNLFFFRSPMKKLWQPSRRCKHLIHHYWTQYLPSLHPRQTSFHQISVVVLLSLTKSGGIVRSGYEGPLHEFHGTRRSVPFFLFFKRVLMNATEFVVSWLTFPWS